MSFNSKKIRQFRCKSCAGELELQDERTRFVACPYCGSVADARSDAFTVLSKNESPKHFPPRSFLKLGMLATLNDQEYKIIGRTRCKIRYKEYWEEEGETGYSNEEWTYDEWLLIGEDATFFMIVEDANGFTYSFNLIPKYPSLPSGTQTRDFETNQARRVTEYGDCSILYFEGESTYLINPGDKVGFSQYKDGAYSYISEWRYDKNGEIKEIEFFREIKVSKERIFNAFRADDSVKGMIAKNNEKYEVKRANKRLFFIAGAVNLIISIIFLFITVAKDSNENNIRFTEHFDANASFARGNTYKINDSVTATSIISTKTFSFMPDDKALEITFNAEVPKDEFEGMYRLQILNSKKEIVFNTSFYDYYYVNYSPTQTADNITNFSKTFRLEDAKGEYTVKTIFEIPDKYKIKDTQKIGANVKIKKYISGGNFGLFFVLGIIFLLISLFIRKPRKID